MSRSIVVHAIAGILFVGVGTPDAQESIPPAVVEARDTLTNTGVPRTRNDSKNEMLVEPGVLSRLDCVAGIEEVVGVAVAIAPNIHLDDPNDNIEGRQNSDRSARDAGSPQAKAGTARRWFSSAMLWMVEFLASGLAVYTGGR